MSQTQSDNGSGDTLDKTKLIVNYIPQNATEDDLLGIFMQVGELESIKIMRNTRTGYSYGYGFVKYTTEVSAERAIALLNGYAYRNKTLKVSYARPPSQVSRDSNLYISNLPKTFTEENLMALFGKYGEIIQRNLLKDKKTGEPRGVAFVRFSRGEEAQAAIAELDGTKLENMLFPLNVRVADDHTKQRVHMMEQQIYQQPPPPHRPPPHMMQNCYRPPLLSGQQTMRGMRGYHQQQQQHQHQHRFMGAGGDFHHLLSDVQW